MTNVPPLRRQVLAGWQKVSLRNAKMPDLLLQLLPQRWQVERTQLGLGHDSPRLEEQGHLPPPRRGDKEIASRPHSHQGQRLAGRLHLAAGRRGARLGGLGAAPR